MANLCFQDWMPAGSVFFEEEEIYSSTIKAVRRAYQLHDDSFGHPRPVDGAARDEDALYYLV
jgi:hypothetical protein